MADGTRILLVDDERDFRESTSMLLELEGFHVTTAEGGPEALAALSPGAAAHASEVVLLDFRMPGLNGGQVLQEIRARGIEACVILISAVADLLDVARRFGFDAALPKPCDADQLIAAIRRCIGTRRT